MNKILIAIVLSAALFSCSKKEDPAPADLVLYPNLNDGIFFIETRMEGDMPIPGNLKASVYDSTGTFVESIEIISFMGKSKSSTSWQYRMEMKNKISGRYSIKAEAKDKIETTKFTIK
jgi:hypothetical protein